MERKQSILKIFRSIHESTKQPNIRHIAMLLNNLSEVEKIRREVH